MGFQDLANFFLSEREDGLDILLLAHVLLDLEDILISWAVLGLQLHLLA